MRTLLARNWGILYMKEGWEVQGPKWPQNPCDLELEHY